MALGPNISLLGDKAPSSQGHLSRSFALLQRVCQGPSAQPQLSAPPTRGEGWGPSAPAPRGLCAAARPCLLRRQMRCQGQDLAGCPASRCRWIKAATRPAGCVCPRWPWTITGLSLGSPWPFNLGCTARSPSEWKTHLSYSLKACPTLSRCGLASNILSFDVMKYLKAP